MSLFSNTQNFGLTRGQQTSFRALGRRRTPPSVESESSLHVSAQQPARNASVASPRWCRSERVKNNRRKYAREPSTRRGDFGACRDPSAALGGSCRVVASWSVSPARDAGAAPLRATAVRSRVSDPLTPCRSLLESIATRLSAELPMSDSSVRDHLSATAPRSGVGAAVSNGPRCRHVRAHSLDSDHHAAQHRHSRRRSSAASLATTSLPCRWTLASTWASPLARVTSTRAPAHSLASTPSSASPNSRSAHVCA